MTVSRVIYILEQKLEIEKLKSNTELFVKAKIPNRFSVNSVEPDQELIQQLEESIKILKNNEQLRLE